MMFTRYPLVSSRFRLRLRP